jgi:Leucine-rich repeat (LRR) protein
VSLGMGFGGLASLVVLRAAGNRLDSIPDQLRRLDSLELLDLADNQLTSFPATLTACTSLRVLRVPRNRLEKLCPGNLQMFYRAKLPVPALSLHSLFAQGRYETMRIASGQYSEST